ncbi:MAG: SLC13 family permease [Bacteroidales bacterium]|nr:SLC13 family permease [Bacteroidales bacterium]
MRQFIGFLVVPVIFLYLILFADLAPGKPEITYTLAVAVLMAGWWITEIIPLAVTSLLPVVLLPFLGVMDGKDVSSAYFNHVIFLFIGGFIVALAMQKWDLHKRIALKIMLITGTSPRRVLLGFMAATAFLSMWISNTATAMMMVPILLSISKKLKDFMDEKSHKKFTTGLLLGVAYSASIGGIATLVGTPPNLSFARIFQIMFPGAPEISFSNWFLFALPISLVLFFITWIFLYKRYKPAYFESSHTESAIRTQYTQLGKASYEERIVLVLFVLLAILWLSRSTLTIGNLVVPGWSSLLPYPEQVNDGTVAIAISVLLFIIPTSGKDGLRLMDWKTAKKLPWNIVLLFGGGFALANAFKVSGLSLWVGEQMGAAAGLPIILIIVLISLTMTFLTELTSNTATTEMLLPVLAGLSVSVEINPLLFMLPATLSASMAFMLPVATPPNAIVFGSNQLSVGEMVKTGIILNLIGVVVITLATYYWGSYLFDIDMSQMPLWASPVN